MRKAFSQKFPKATVQSVTKLPYLGLYEIVVEGEVLYADDKFEYLLDGSIISTKNMTNLTEQRKQRLSAIPFNELPLELAFKKVKGNGERKLAVFSDPDCPFCKRVENDLAKLDNVTIYMFLFPIDSLHPKAPEMAKKIWCSPDKVKAWDDYMQKGTVPASDSAVRTQSTRSSSTAARRASMPRLRWFSPMVIGFRAPFPLRKSNLCCPAKRPKKIESRFDPVNGR